MAAQSQAAAWGARADDWAEVQEAVFKPLHAALLEKTVHPNLSLLDMGCGSGAFCRMAAAAGAAVSGIDISPELISIARRRVPDGDFRVADMGSLPYEDDRFDLVVGINSFHQADCALRAGQEAARVARPGGRVVVATWSRPEECEALSALDALDRAIDWKLEERPATPAVEDRSFEQSVAMAGLEPVESGEVSCPWLYPDRDMMLRGMMAAGPVVARAQLVGEEKVRDGLVDAMAPYRTRSGGYRLDNVFRFVIAQA